MLELDRLTERIRQSRWIRRSKILAAAAAATTSPSLKSEEYNRLLEDRNAEHLCGINADWACKLIIGTILSLYKKRARWDVVPWRELPYLWNYSFQKIRGSIASRSLICSGCKWYGLFILFYFWHETRFYEADAYWLDPDECCYRTVKKKKEKKTNKQQQGILLYIRRMQAAKIKNKRQSNGSSSNWAIKKQFK